MKFALVSSFVPFIDGGARFIVEWLEEKLREHGHAAEKFYLPFHEEPDTLLDQISAYRLLNLADNYDRLITFRPPAHVVRHPHKIAWFIHHIRAFYDLWDTRYCTIPHDARNSALRETLVEIDNVTLGEAKAVFTNSRVVASRLRQYNGLTATPLYPPILRPERFQNHGYGDEVVVICRVEPHKRQALLVDAMRYVKTAVRLRLCGVGAHGPYIDSINSSMREGRLGSRVAFENRWVSEAEKVARLAPALAVAYVPMDEDSYGYPSLEAAHAEKAVLTTTDSGGVLELIRHEANGLVAEPEAKAIAAALDRLFLDRQLAQTLGRANASRVNELEISWDRVISAFTR